MNTSILQFLWDDLDRLDVTPTEALVLFALSCSANDVAGCCHPKMEKIVAKTHLALPTVKKATRSLKRKELVSWHTKSRHANEYKLVFASRKRDPAPSCDAEQHDNGNGHCFANRADEAAETSRKACALLAYDFARLLRDPGKRALATADFRTAIVQRGFLSSFDRFFDLKAKAKVLTDDDIYSLILATLTASTSQSGSTHE